MEINKKFEDNVKKWFEDKGDIYKRINYPELNSDSIVFDVGGYMGTFTESIYIKYSSNIFVFEPVKDFFDVCNFKFSHIPKIKTFNYGLSSEDKRCIMYVSGDASSTTIIDGGRQDYIELKDIAQVIKNMNIKSIDLLKINIEGEEYNLMERLVRTPDVLNIIKNIQVQYHTFIKSAEEKRKNINLLLSNTHECNWCYEWVWENWKLK